MRKAIALNLVLVSLATALAQAASPTTRGRHVSNEILVKFRGTVAGPFEEQLSPGGPVKELGLSRGLGELNTRYKVRKIEPVFKNFGKNRQRLKALLKKDKAGLTKKERHVLERLSRAPKNARVPELGRIYKIQVELEPGQSLEEAVNAFNSDPNVEYAEMNYIVSTCKTPCDNLYPVQWALNNTGQDYPINESEVRRGTADCDIDAPEAWDVNTGSFEVVVAVIDTGVDYGHRDLAWNIWVNEDEVFGNGIDDDDNGYTDDIVGYDFINHDSDPRDDNGHGTHCAGIIAAWGDNFLSIAGVCWNARIMPLKFLSEAGEGQESDAATAIYYAVENGADVTSNSYGGPDYSQTMEEAIAYAHSQGVIMVAAAGNDNTDSAHYPAYHEQMIAVAATDSMDRKAGFSSYGDWVDISAPGVDILSLRGWGTSLGEVYDAFTTILSGTSMACPHLAGVAALTLSQNPQAPTEYVTAKLVTAADDISDKNPDYEGLLGTGRVNAFKAVRDGAEGFITLDKNSYSCNDVAAVKVVDADLTGQPTQDIAVTTGAGDEETMTLVADVNKPWVFTASICTVPGPAAAEDGVLQVGHGQTVTGTYYDSDSGSGIPAVAEASATIDCEPPVVLDVEITYVYSSLAKIIFTTDEPTTASLRCGLACGGPYNIVQHHQTLATKHTFVLSKLQSETTYYFEIEAVDSLGNQTTDDANGQCYAFTTPPTPPPVHVPGQYPTIQEAIDAATTGGTVVIADGIYTGEGNRDLSFGGKAITVRSENGPENCIIDCQGTQTQQHRAFRGLGYNCVLQGLTITNAYHDRGALYCSGRPTITDCIITGNRGLYAGGISCPSNSYPTISHCIITNNTSVHEGGGIRCGASDSHLTLSNCIISGNNAGYGAGIHWASWEGSIKMTNCVVCSNVAAVLAGGIWVHNKCTATISNSVFWGNVAVAWGPLAAQIYVSTGADAPVAYVSYCDIQDGWTGPGNIDADPRFVDAGGGDYHLRQESPCINAGDPNYSGAPTEADMDGQPRVIGGRIDIGADEFHGDNTPPVADAGEDQTVYAGICGTAKVTLDGSGSYDADDHPLTYLWSWTTDNNSFTATGPCPTVELPAGVHVIKLTVNDRVEDSEPDAVVITAVSAIEVRMKFTPQALNPGSQGNWVKAHFTLPEGLAVEDVNTNTPAKIEPVGIESEYMNVFVNEEGLVEIEAGFDRAKFCDEGPAEGTIKAGGALTSGQYFYGTGTLKIITGNFEYLMVLASHWLELSCGAPDWCNGTDLDQNSVVNFVDFALFDGCCIDITAD